jgi:hypothetical protein
MPKLPCKCPSEETLERGHSRQEGWFRTEAEANAALPALLAASKPAALAAQAAAVARFRRQVLCEAGCFPLLRTPALEEWTAVGSVEPYTAWLARAGYSWNVVLECVSLDLLPPNNVA